MVFVLLCSLWTGDFLHVAIVLASNSLIKLAQREGCLFLFISENTCYFNKHKQTLVTTEYGIIRQLIHMESTHNAKHNGSHLFPIRNLRI